MPYYTYFYNTYKLELWIDEEETTVKRFKNHIVGLFHNLSCRDINVQIKDNGYLYEIDDNELIDPDHILDLRLDKLPTFPAPLRQTTDLDNSEGSDSGSEASDSDSEGSDSDSEANGSDSEASDSDSEGSDSCSDTPLARRKSI
jgi:U3 small nucleolar RNA-associated protein 14